MMLWAAWGSRSLRAVIGLLLKLIHAEGFYSNGHHSAISFGSSVKAVGSILETLIANKHLLSLCSLHRFVRQLLRVSRQARQD
ncbi:hypothetical protein BJY04DRAFT_199403, partial [Aspergillus karnatakaensis]|uniref:uncharacterized protein n=1 Tax=Aspergillus karnatakaensis TaxID=1810916 RepID=UPI003CCCE07E